jgi:hypothetical protein
LSALLREAAVIRELEAAAGRKMRRAPSDPCDTVG